MLWCPFAGSQSPLSLLDEDCFNTLEISLAFAIAIEGMISLRDESGSNRLKLSSLILELTGLK